MDKNIQDTIVALATPLGESAIAMIRLSGEGCYRIAEGAFSLKKTMLPRMATFVLYHDTSGVVVDQVVATYFRSPASYTGEAMLELSCHGNPLIAQKIVEDCIVRGARLAEPGEFTRRAFLNNKIDLTQAEAVMDVIHARSEKALRAANQQLAGRLGQYVNATVEDLLQISAEIEAYIDFPEEDLPMEDPNGPVVRLGKMIAGMESLRETSHYTTILHEGIKTVIVGAPNAGKSSLMNALLGEDRAIVSPTPGTTRDFISERMVVGPYCLQVIDTAGIHEAGSAIEALGISKTLEKIQQADFYLLVLDLAEAHPPTLPASVLEQLSPAKTLIVENKTDLAKQKTFSDFLPSVPRVRVSLKTGEGLESLRGSIIKTIERDKIVPSEEDLIVSARHATALGQATAALRDALGKIRGNISSELVASDIRLAMDALAQIVGRIDNERMLDKLFSSFCIGK